MKLAILSLAPEARAGHGEPPSRLKQMPGFLERVGVSCVHVVGPSAESLSGWLDGNPCDLVFSSIHELPSSGGRRVNVHALLDERKQAYIGSPGDVLDLVRSKGALKNRWVEQGIRTPAYRTVDGSARSLEALRLWAMDDGVFPLIVKPALEGNSRGIDLDSVVWEASTLLSLVETISRHHGETLIEAFLGAHADIREFTVVMLGSCDLLYPAEIRLTHGRTPRLVTTSDKNLQTAWAEPVVEPALRSRLAAFALEAFSVAGVRDYARCDVLLAQNELHALEINGQPMVPDSWFSACCRGGALDAAQSVYAMVAAAIIRQEPLCAPMPVALEEAIPSHVLRALRDRACARVGPCAG